MRRILVKNRFLVLFFAALLFAACRRRELL